LEVAIQLVVLYLLLIRILLSGWRALEQGPARFLTAWTEEIAVKFPLSRRGLLGLLAAGVLLVGGTAHPDDRPAPDRAAVERARTTVKMLDDVYKGFVVNITETYVKAKEKTPAARVVKKMFKYMETKDWHTGRLVDASGEPVNPDNVARTAFEKKAVDKMKAGASYYEEVGTNKKGQAVLRAATRVPVVMKACIACHPGKKEGDLLGTLVYEVPIK